MAVADETGDSGHAFATALDWLPGWATAVVNLMSDAVLNSLEKCMRYAFGIWAANAHEIEFVGTSAKLIISAFVVMPRGLHTRFASRSRMSTTVIVRDRKTEYHRQVVTAACTVAVRTYRVTVTGAGAAAEASLARPGAGLR